MVNKEELERFLAYCNWGKDGDSNEKKHFTLIQTYFPNLEQFWKYFVVPSTNRIHQGKDYSGDPIRQPEKIKPEIVIIGNHNYQIFLHIIYICSKINNQSDLFVYGDIYSHIVSILDNFESLVFKFYTFLTKFNDRGLNLSKKMTEEEFLKICKEWYNDSYTNLYQKYKTEGTKLPPIKVDKIINPIKEYFTVEVWKEYSTFSNNIRQTRNFFVHGIFPGVLYGYIPKHNYLVKYADDWRKLFNIQKLDYRQRKKIIDEDFILAKEQVRNDQKCLFEILNSMYEQVLKDLKEVAFKNNPNQKYWDEFDIKLD